MDCPAILDACLFRVRTPPGKSLKLLEFNSYPGMSWNMLKNQIELLKKLYFGFLTITLSTSRKIKEPKNKISIMRLFRVYDTIMCC